MARIAGVNVPDHKYIVIGLTAIYGIGRLHAQKIYKVIGTPTDKRVRDLMDPDQDTLRKETERFPAKDDLCRETAMNIRRLVDLGYYRDVCHHKGLPMRGQHVRTNAHTRKGPRKTDIAFEK